VNKLLTSGQRASAGAQALVPGRSARASAYRPVVVICYR
jgi:hypothetical protein